TSLADVHAMFCDRSWNACHVCWLPPIVTVCSGCLGCIGTFIPSTTTGSLGGSSLGASTTILHSAGIMVLLRSVTIPPSAEKLNIPDTIGKICPNGHDISSLNPKSGAVAGVIWLLTFERSLLKQCSYNTSDADPPSKYMQWISDHFSLKEGCHHAHHLVHGLRNVLIWFFIKSGLVMPCMNLNILMHSGSLIISFVVRNFQGMPSVAPHSYLWIPVIFWISRPVICFDVGWHAGPFWDFKVMDLRASSIVMLAFKEIRISGSSGPAAVFLVGCSFFFDFPLSSTGACDIATDESQSSGKNPGLPSVACLLNLSVVFLIEEFPGVWARSTELIIFGMSFFRNTVVSGLTDGIDFGRSQSTSYLLSLFEALTFFLWLPMQSSLLYLVESRKFDSLKSWNDHFFWIDARICPIFVSWYNDMSVRKDPLPSENLMDLELLEKLDNNHTFIRQYLKTFLSLVGLNYSFEDLHVRSTLLKSNEIGRFWLLERTLAEGEVPLITKTADMVVAPSAQTVRLVDHTIIDELEEHAGKKKRKIPAALRRLELRSGPQGAESGSVLHLIEESVSSSVTHTPDPDVYEDSGLTQDVNVQTHYVPDRFVVATSSSEHGDTDVSLRVKSPLAHVEAENIDVECTDGAMASSITEGNDIYVPEWSVTNDARVDNPALCHNLLDHITSLGFWVALCNQTDARILDGFNVNSAQHACMVSVM
nr:hypothetical protein [Tanacetum cinerariifolium]